MSTEEQLILLHHCLAKAHNALNIFKFSMTTASLNKEARETFSVLAIDAYYSMYTNLAVIFDGTKNCLSLEKLLKIKNHIKEQDRINNLAAYNLINEEHKTTIKKLDDVRSNAVAHLSKEMKNLDLQQNSQDIQALIGDLLRLFDSLEGFDMGKDKPYLLSDFPKIRDDLGQRALWNDFIMKKYGL